MAVLTSKDRSSLPDSAFLGPNRSFPVNDPEHARKAIQLAPKSANAGNISQSTAASIQARARARLNKFRFRSSKEKS